MFRISFPDITDASLTPLEKCTVIISGNIDNVYAARENIVVSTCRPREHCGEYMPPERTLW